MNTAIQYCPQGTTAKEIAGSIEAALRQGQISSGDPLPTVRRLAEELAVSPTTVAAAYRELRRRGIVTGAGRAGTRIRLQPPLSTRMAFAAPSGVRNLLSGGPDPALLPKLPRLSIPQRLYGEPALSSHLSRVAARSLRSEGIDSGNLAVVGGALDGVERVLSAWLRIGDRVAIEDPGYSAVLDLVAAMGLQAVPVALDDRGVRPADLDEALALGVQALVVTPRAQNPTGSAWDQERAEQLAEVLSGYPEVVLVEDDHAGPVAGTPASTLARATERWVTIRSVSKWLGPDLRLALLAGDEASVSRIEGRQALGTGWVSNLLQETVAELWEDPATGDLLKEATSTYAHRRQALHDELQDQGITSSARSGLTTWVPVGDEHGVAAGLLAAGWAVAPGERFRIASAPGIRIAHSTLEPREAADLALALNKVLRSRSVRAD